MQELQQNNVEHMEELQDICVRQLNGIIKFGNFSFYTVWSKEDYMSEAISHMWKQRFKFDSNRGKFSTWFSKISINIYYDYYNKMKDAVDTNSLYAINQEGEEMNILESLGESRSCETEVISKEVCKKILDKLFILPADQRRAIDLCRIKGYKPGEAAVIMGCKASDVSRWINRGLKKIEAYLREDDLFRDYDLSA